MTEFENARAFRKALGAFATGVTIVTTRDRSGEPIGVTASSFNSVSLHPPLVLWSLAKSSLSRQAFSDSGHFAVHVLAEGQEHMADRFARSGEDKFAGLDWDHCERGSPLFNDFAARFECKLVHEYDGGDHVILVGEVSRFDTKDHPPLLYHGGSYGQFRELDTSADAPGKPPLTGPNS